MRPELVLQIIGFASAVFRLHRDISKWHISNTGVPQYISLVGESNASVVTTDENCIARLSDDGLVVWRQTQELGPVEVAESSVIVHSTADNQLTAYQLKDGAEIWKRPLKLDLFTTINSSIYYASGRTLGKLDSDGKLLWTKVVDFDPEAIFSENSRLFLSSGSQVFELDLRSAQVSPSSIEHAKPRWELDRRDPHNVSLWINGDKIWQRDERLAHVVDAGFVEAQIKEVIPTEESWRERMARHVAQFRNYSAEPLHHESQSDYLVLLTNEGRLVALRDGDLVWEKSTGLEGSVKLKPLGDHFAVCNSTRTELFDSNGAFLGTHDETDFVDLVDGTLFRQQGGEKLWSVPAIAAKSRDVVSASIGRFVNRNDVWYKYLNPNVIVVAQYEDRILTVQIIDAVTGEVQFTSSHRNVEINAEWNFSLVFGEYWVAYSYLQLGPAIPKLTVLELYESESYNVHNDTLGYVRDYTFTLDEQITSMAASQTKYGATSHCLVLATRSGDIYALPQELLHDWYQKTSQLALNPRFLISNQGDLGLSRLLVAAPTKYESTGVVASVGDLDVFHTRLTPSGEFDQLDESFNFSGVIFSLFLVATTAYVLFHRVRFDALSQTWQ